MGIYLSPVWHTIAERYRRYFGYIDNIHIGGVSEGIKTSGRPWMLDNGVFSGRFTIEKLVSVMTFYREYSDTCIGVVVPDALKNLSDGSVIGDWQLTVKQYHEYLPIVREYGYPAAFVSQDGLPVNAVPWDNIDVLFVGGSDYHKLKECWPLINEAQRRGKWVHIGRVNSAKRIALFWMADSWDGTTLAIEPSTRNQQRILFAARNAAAKQQQRRLL